MLRRVTYPCIEYKMLAVCEGERKKKEMEKLFTSYQEDYGKI
jgi:hypothetical protein